MSLIEATKGTKYYDSSFKVDSFNHIGSHSIYDKVMGIDHDMRMFT